MNLEQQLTRLKLTWIHDNLQTELADAARKQRTHQEFLERLLSGEIECRTARSVDRHLRAARLPVAKGLDTFDWNWPKVVNKDQIRHLFSLGFMKDKANVVFIGPTGVGKTHLAIALAMEACQKNRSVRFSTAANIINSLTATLGTPKHTETLKLYTAPELLVVDELGYLPVDQKGANMLFQVFTARYECASTVITTNRPFKDWSKTFDNDATLTSAVLDRIVHHCEPIILQGRSYRLKGRMSGDMAE